MSLRGFIVGFWRKVGWLTLGCLTFAIIGGGILLVMGWVLGIAAVKHAKG